MVVKLKVNNLNENLKKKNWGKFGKIKLFYFVVI